MAIQTEERPNGLSNNDGMKYLFGKKCFPGFQSLIFKQRGIFHPVIEGGVI